MRLNRHAVGALAATAAAARRRRRGTRGVPDRRRPSGRCDARLAQIAERRGVTVEQLQADVKARLLARIDAAEKAGRVSSERADEAPRARRGREPCGATASAFGRMLVARGMLRRDAARFLELDREELRAQLPGTSLAALAEKQGKSVASLEAAMVAPAKGAAREGRREREDHAGASRRRSRRSSRRPPTGSRSTCSRRGSAHTRLEHDEGPLARAFVRRAVDRRELLHPRPNRTGVRKPCEFPKSCLRDRRLGEQAGRGPERLGLVGPLPREVAVVAAEVAVRRGLRVDRPHEVEVADDRAGPEVEVLADELLDPRRAGSPRSRSTRR